MRASRLLPVLLISTWIASACSAPAPAQAPAPTPEPTPQPGPSQPAGATPTLGSVPPDKPAETAETVDIRGKVVQARRNAQGEPPVGTLQVEGALEPGTRYDKATIHVGHKSRIFLGRGGKPTSFSFIHIGDLVEVTFTGPVAESYPVKATAATVVILEHTP